MLNVNTGISKCTLEYGQRFGDQFNIWNAPANLHNAYIATVVHVFESMYIMYNIMIQCTYE